MPALFGRCLVRLRRTTKNTKVRNARRESVLKPYLLRVPSYLRVLRGDPYPSQSSSRRFLVPRLDRRDDVVRAHGEPAVVAHRRELVGRHAGLEHQHVAELAVAVLLDDEDDLVSLEEAPHLVAERKPAHTQVV